MNQVNVEVFDYRDPKIQNNPMIPKNNMKDVFMQNQDYIFHMFERVGSMYVVYQDEVSTIMSSLYMSSLFQHVDFRNCVMWYFQEI